MEELKELVIKKLKVTISKEYAAPIEVLALTELLKVLIQYPDQERSANGILINEIIRNG